VTGLIVFGRAKPPPAATAITDPFSDNNDSTLPELRRYLARDGTQLSFREYPVDGRQVAVLIHGSAGSSNDMHRLAMALQSAGVAALVPDLRGHGSNRPHGDIEYAGQLDDDIADFLAKEKPRFPHSVWTAVGFSSGAAFALRISAEIPLGKSFDRYIFVSPYLRYNAPSVRPAGSGTASWAAASTGRIIGLTILNAIGVHLWDGLPVLAFPVPPHMDSATQTYSWRMQKNFGAHDDYLADIRSAARPVQVFVGSADQLLDADKLRIEFQSQRRDVGVIIIPGLGHSGMVTDPAAIRAIVASFQ